jgi:capsular exopolysaccharide synthesis family protein
VHCLTGGESLDQLVQPTGVPGLFLLPSGTIPPNPSELLASDRMRELFQVAQKRFDLIIVDTPPLLAVTDASVLGSMVDGVVFCLYAGRVQRAEARASTDRLRISGARVLGTVLNRYVAGKGGDDKHYHYYYQYHAYGEDDRGASGTSAA